MDIQSAKLELVKLILNLDNQQVINKILHLLKSEQEDFWLQLSDDEREEIKTGIKQLDAGERITIEDFLDRVS
ncbi:MAG TPA: hypothetical protein ENJ39_08315 [Flammeovirgaceae bacterium]|nr:hypothetical protein [Flammeovirgaceae bacterium]